MLEQLLAEALPVYSHFLLTIIELGLTLTLTFYVLLVCYSKLQRDGSWEVNMVS